MYVHAKVTLNEDAFWVQTANLTKSSFESNREHFFYSNDSNSNKGILGFKLNHLFLLVILK